MIQSKTKRIKKAWPQCIRIANARPPEFAHAKSGAAGGSKQSLKRAEINPFDKLRINAEQGRSIKNNIMATKDILEKAKKELADLTGFKSPSATGFKKEGNDWVATIEVIEKESIPDGMDILGTYEVRVDQSGKIIGYERTDLRKRIDTTLNKEV